MKHSLAIIAAGILMAGCGTLEGKLNNRIACTVAGDKLFVLSEYGPLSLGTVIAEQDRKTLCPLVLKSAEAEKVK